MFRILFYACGRIFFCFFFQAEDGIRDLYVTGVQTCALPICIRRAGSAALDLCWVACGRVDGYWEWRLKPWDSAAGKLIVEEAGGKLSDFSGRAFSVYGEQTLATNGRVHREMLAVMKRLSRR